MEFGLGQREFFAAMRGEESGASTIRSRECLFLLSTALALRMFFSLSSSCSSLPTVEAKINKSVPHESKIHTEKMFLLRSIFDVSGTICIRIFNLLLFRVPPYALMRVGRKGGGWCERNFVLRLVTRTHILGTKERESEWESE
jgi:hypothetical protein